MILGSLCINIFIICINIFTICINIFTIFRLFYPICINIFRHASTFLQFYYWMFIWL